MGKRVSGEGATTDWTVRLRGGGEFPDQKEPLIGAVEGFESLDARYEEGEANEAFRRKIKEIKAKYQGGYRKVKGDGNCFIRGYLFGVFESLVRGKGMSGKQSLTQGASHVDGRMFGYYMKMTKDTSQGGLGYSMGAVEDFYDQMSNMLGSIKDGTMTMDMLDTTMNEAQVSNSLVFFCRMLCSCHIQTNPEHFAPFLGLDEGSPESVRKALKQYCTKEVEPLEKEVEELEIIALAAAFGVKLRIEHMDSSEGALNHHDVPDEPGEEPEVFMLYRPGHYDLIYPSK